jgi:magnesium chelatase subunit I
LARKFSRTIQKTIALARKITEQEAQLSAVDKDAIVMSEIAKDLLEQVAFTARDSEYVNAKSGVSARLTISAMENLMAAAKLRLIETGAEKTAIRLVDFSSIIPAITGKIELVYEGEQEGAAEVAQLLIDQAIVNEFEKIFPKIPKLEKPNVKTPYTDVIAWFNTNTLELNYTDTDKDFNASLNKITPLVKLVKEYCPDLSPLDKLFCMEMVIWSLSINKKLDKMNNEKSFTF